MEISFVVAMDRNALIGCNGRLPWCLPTDLKRFREITVGHPLVMGRKTFDSIGRPLPGRRNIVVSRRASGSWALLHCVELARSIPEAIGFCSGRSRLFIVGGAQVFAVALPLADRIYLTFIDHEFDPGGSPVYFPGGIPGPPEWYAEVERVGTVDGKNPWPHQFRILDRSVERGLETHIP